MESRRSLHSRRPISRRPKCYFFFIVVVESWFSLFLSVQEMVGRWRECLANSASVRPRLGPAGQPDCGLALQISSEFDSLPDVVSYRRSRSSPRSGLPSKHRPASSTVWKQSRSWRFPVPNRITAGARQSPGRSDLRGRRLSSCGPICAVRRTRFMLSGPVPGIKSNITVMR
jgi:hypothetical protein